MTEFQAYATSFEIYPKEGEAFQYLLPILGRIERLDFTLRVNDPSVNQGQMISDFDEELKKMLQTLGAEPWNLTFPHPQEFDFAFMFAKRRVVVEIEKTNCEKILRDILSVTCISDLRRRFHDHWTSEELCAYSWHLESFRVWCE